MICLYLKIPERFVRLIFYDRFSVVHILFVCVVKFKLLAQFPMDHLPHPVVSSLIVFLCCYHFFYCYHYWFAFINLVFTSLISKRIHFLRISRTSMILAIKIIADFCFDSTRMFTSVSFGKRFDLFTMVPNTPTTTGMTFVKSFYIPLSLQPCLDI